MCAGELERVLRKLCFNRPERTEVHTNVIARRDWNRRNASTGCHNLPGEQSVTEVTEFVCDPSERDARVAENIGATSGASVFEISVALNAVLRQIKITPVRFYRRAQDKPTGTGVVSNQLRCSDDRVVLEA